MNLQKIYTALLTADLAAAEGWYTKLLGRGPDYRPMDTLVQWELFDQGGLALSSDDEIAGRGVMFLYRAKSVSSPSPLALRLGRVACCDHRSSRHQMADDKDPFGSPPSRLFSASVFCISIVIGAAGAYRSAGLFTLAQMPPTSPNRVTGGI